jgi:hypothetical protein
VRNLARLLCNQGCLGDGIACLQPVYDRFPEGFGTADLTAANQPLLLIPSKTDARDTAVSRQVELILLPLQAAQSVIGSSNPFNV